MLEKLAGWPEGTQKIEKSDGSKEIKLPKPTDMGQFSRNEHKNAAFKSKVEEASKSEDLQYSGDLQGRNTRLTSTQADLKIINRGRDHRRQEIIEKQRREELKFKQKQEDTTA